MRGSYVAVPFQVSADLAVYEASPDFKPLAAEYSNTKNRLSELQTWIRRYQEAEDMESTESPLDLSVSSPARRGRSSTLTPKKPRTPGPSPIRVQPGKQLGTKVGGFSFGF